MEYLWGPLHFSNQGRVHRSILGFSGIINYLRLTRLKDIICKFKDLVNLKGKHRRIRLKVLTEYFPIMQIQ